MIRCLAFGFLFSIVLFSTHPSMAENIKAQPGDEIVATARDVESLPVKVVGVKIDWVEQWRGGPESYTAADREFLQEIYRGAQDAGLRLAGIAGIRNLKEAENGYGHTGTIVVRVAATGKILPGWGSSNEIATSILQVEVSPDRIVDGNGDNRVVWTAYAKQYDTRTAKLINSTKTEPTADSPANAVRQVLEPIVAGQNALTKGQLQRLPATTPVKSEKGK